MLIFRVVCFVFMLFVSNLRAYVGDDIFPIREIQLFYDAVLSVNKVSALQSSIPRSLYYYDYGNYNFFVYSSNHLKTSKYGNSNSDIFGISGGSNINSKHFYSYGAYYTGYRIDNVKTENAFIFFDYKQVYDTGKSPMKPYIGFSTTVHFFYNTATSSEQLADFIDNSIMVDYNVYHTFNNVLVSPSAYFTMPIFIKPNEFLINHSISIIPIFKFRVGLEGILPFGYKEGWYSLDDSDAETWAFRRYAKINTSYYSAYFDLGFGLAVKLDKVLIKYDLSYRAYAGPKESKILTIYSSNGYLDQAYVIDYRDALAPELSNTLIFDFNLISFFVGSIRKADYRSTFLGVKLKVNEF